MKSALLSAFSPLVLKLLRTSHPVFNLKGSSHALFLLLIHLARTAEDRGAACEDLHIYVTATEEEAERTASDITFYQKIAGSVDLLFLPDQGGAAATGRRFDSALKFRPGGLIVGSSNAFLSPLWTPAELPSHILKLKKGDSIDREELTEKIQAMGYTTSNLATGKGEFRRREWVLDIFPSNLDEPVRLEFFGDEIDAVKRFDIETQRSTGSIESVEIFPAEEDEEGAPLYRHLMRSGRFYYSESVDIEGTDLPGGSILHNLSLDGQAEAPALSLAGLNLLQSEREDIHAIIPALKSLPAGMVLFVLPSRTQAERMKEILQDGEITAPLLSDVSLADYSGRYAVTVGALTSGLHIPGLIILTERELFGRRPLLKPYRASKVSKLLDSVEDLRIGDYVIHRDHGVGRFRGLEDLTSAPVTPGQSAGYAVEVMAIEYAESARLLLPLHSISLVQKYRSEESAVPLLDRLGGKQWKKKRDRTQKKIKELARKLIALHARREVLNGFAFSEDTALHREFDEFFPYDETPDQHRAWEETKREMESARSMDRLICGDVGYGKTEIAMRAAFKAVFDTRQVAVLVPTTILAEQHYRNFQARFSAFPVKIDFLSRFKTPAERRRTLKGMETGEIEIVIGTHSLLSRKTRFYNLGLLIIDEEHRFGVANKERIKELKKRIDCLTLTATPIPRTLEMSLSGIREMSLIETPPEERIAIRSVVSVFSEDLIKDAITRELARSGQVFFVHNRVKDIQDMEDMLKRLFPHARTAYAHGQMSENSLEDVMLRFMDGETDILLATSIIGSGIDVPTANTIIINRADRMGLADLYQMKGRVGRSNIRAYAYFLIPPPARLTAEARKRIKAIENLNYLGAGLRLAMKDLEIRGAGNLLGSEQSGHIHAVGFEMYIDMLKKEVSQLKGVKVEEEIEPAIDLGLNARIPDDYIDDMTERLSIYRRFSLCRSYEEINSLSEELRDRFGRTPAAVDNLIDMLMLKLTARRLRVLSLTASGGTIKSRFSPDTPVSVEEMLECTRVYKDDFRLHKDGFILRAEDGDGEVVKKLKDILNSLVLRISDDE